MNDGFPIHAINTDWITEAVARDRRIPQWAVSIYTHDAKAVLQEILSRPDVQTAVAALVVARYVAAVRSEECRPEMALEMLYSRLLDKITDPRLLRELHGIASPDGTRRQ